MKPILEVKDLWKQYKIGGQQTSYLSLREKVLQPFKKQKKDTFWALQDIDFNIYEGECIGIIGKNGAGKSTLLKILSQITPPTKGYIKARGRIASLLEVGTGFHPELTGRENVYLNGSILGLRRVEINSKFGEIVEFSGVGKFLDTPLKHYSSGMKLRLAFSVAAHLEPEILLIDEVLAVGDAEFQKKCLGKMDEVSKSGRTVVFVSHNLGAVKKLCDRGVLLKAGKLELIADIDKVILEYQEPENFTNFFNHRVVKEKEIYINDVSLKNEANKPTAQFFVSIPLFLHISLFINTLPKNLEISISLYDKFKNRVFTLIEPVQQIIKGNKTEQHLVFKFPNYYLFQGSYSWHIALLKHNVKNYDLVDDVLPFTIICEEDKYIRYKNTHIGNLYPKYEIYTENHQ